VQVEDKALAGAALATANLLAWLALQFINIVVVSSSKIAGKKESESMRR
jgi:hypothetical protein